MRRAVLAAGAVMASSIALAAPLLIDHPRGKLMRPPKKTKWAERKQADRWRKQYLLKGVRP